MAVIPRESAEQPEGITRPVPPTRRFALSRGAPAAARRFAAEVCGDRPDANEIAVLVSELATNAVSHARTAFEVTIIDLEAGGLRIEVADGSGRTPRPSVAGLDPSAEWARGLWIVDVLSSKWGFTTTREGKSVWVEVAGLDGTRSAPA